MSGINNTDRDTISLLINELIDTCYKCLLNREQRGILLPLLDKLQSWRIYYGRNHSSIPDILNSVGNILKDSYLSQLSLYFFKEQLRIEIYYLGSQHPNLAATLNSIGQVYAKYDQFLEAEECFAEAILLLVNGNEEKGRLYALILYNIGMVHYHKSLCVDAMEYFDLSIKEQQATFGEFHFDLAQMHLNIGKLMLESGNIQMSMSNLLKALMIIRMLDEESDQFKVAEILYHIGLIHEVSGEYVEALNSFNQSLDIIRNVQNEHKLTIMNLHKIGLIHRSMGDADKSIKVFEEITNILKEELGETHICVASVLGLLRNVFMEHGMIEKSKNATKEIEEIFCNASEQSPHDTSSGFEGFIIEMFGYIIDNNSSLVAAAA